MYEIHESEVFLENSVWARRFTTIYRPNNPKNDRIEYFLEKNVEFHGITKGMWTISHENTPR